MSDYFPITYEKTMGHEGLYSNDANDPGGETWKGIARNRHPSWEGWSLIDEVRRRNPDNVTSRSVLNSILNASTVLEYEVKKFYRFVFWEALWGDRVAEHSPEIAMELFDTGVNTGKSRAVEFLQDGLNLLNRNGTVWADILVDGSFGSKTMAAFLACANDSKTGVSALYKQMNISQGAHYQRLMRSNPQRFERYIGWFNRIDFLR
jgi:lysozyme family protein